MAARAVIIIAAGAAVALGQRDPAIPDRKAALGDRKAAAPAVPTPSADVLRWTRAEVESMVTFNMATMATNCTGNGFCVLVGGCSGWLPDVDAFNPTALDTDQWARSLRAFGAKYSVLVAQHCSGFSMFPQHAAVLAASGVNYTYGVEFTAWGGGERDVAGEFVASCKKYGIQPAFYYSLNHNYYLNTADGKVQPGPLLPGQIEVTQDQYDAIALAQYGALLENYGALAEVWFDGGMDHIPGFSALLAKAQPHAAYMGGAASTPNNVRWVGTESGLPAYPIWSTDNALATVGPGVPNGTLFNPAETDTTFYSTDHWFWSPDPRFEIREMKALKAIYHHSVGQNSNLLMNFSPDNTGLIPDAHAKRYAAFGAWVAACYGAAAAATSGADWALGITDLPAGVDRVVIRENQTLGEAVLTYELVSIDGDNITIVGNGTAVGNKRIHLLPAALPEGITLVFKVLTATKDPVIAHFGAYLGANC